MKKITLLAVAAFTAMLSFTSCNSDGTSFEWPTLEQTKSMVSNLGRYQDGSFVYYNENKANTKDVTDTIPNITATITTNTSKDQQGNISSYYGTATFNFPTKVLANFIREKPLSEAVAKMESKEMAVDLIPYSYASQVFLANPKDLKLGDITAGGNTYKDVTVKFYINQYSAGYITNSVTKKQYFAFSMLAGVIYVNNNPTSYLQQHEINNYKVDPAFMFTTDKQQ